ncbi:MULTISPECIES: cyclopropane-fatty-acyl-phospholipid synthase family protein [unclassified Streptomyces]|uniref:SAM-dependent methyltransferase n=1 Tax=unclassified Streptomyces TaxID=2593676 RepID=UPI001646021B|nr:MULTISPECIES: class I SAM-dependent methyltransferase [unclassified Streptomyces]
MADVDEAGLITYLTTNRAFMAPTVEQAVGLLDLAGSRRVLDVGTGAGGGMVALARAAGEQARVLGVDRNESALALARRHAADEGVLHQVRTEAADLLEVAAKASEEGRYDAIWASDAIWPGNVEDPASAVAQLAEALVPGGVLALFTSNYYSSTFLPGHARLERQLLTASELDWGIPADGPHHYARHLHWLTAAGLRDLRLHVLPRIGFPADSDPAVRPYLEDVVWPQLLAGARSQGTEAGMTRKDLARAEALLTPGNPEYVVDEPGYYLVHPALLVTGLR